MQRKVVYDVATSCHHVGALRNFSMSKPIAIDSDLLIEFALDLFEDQAIDCLDRPDLDYYIEQCDSQGAVELVSAFNDWEELSDVSHDQLDKEYVEVRIGLVEDDEFDLVYARVLLKANQKSAQEFSLIKWKR